MNRSGFVRGTFGYAKRMHGDTEMLENTPETGRPGATFASRLLGSFEIKARFRKNFLSPGNIRAAGPAMFERNNTRTGASPSDRVMHAELATAAPAIAHGKAGR
ncbi:hypothetical protein [Oceanicella sp. SM1341]|uniref:hypothetical protein n=1 Tax=Oceanicella sp. SM1341 TaxID=1548889 RepID=UPI0013002190|nr:hypothetical protein [Oceanicella sp. SM1341]